MVGMVAFIPHHGHHHTVASQCGRVVTAKQSHAFVDTVWEPSRWRRGSPPRQTRLAWRHMLSCAGPGNRHAMKKRWRDRKRQFYAKRSHCRSGPLFVGRVSVFSGGLTAGGYQATEPGIALYNQGTLGEMFVVTTTTGRAVLRQTDIGPAPWTGRVIDITEASQSLLGGSVVTDSTGSAKLIPADCF
jgi:hypothetical protein